MFTSMLAAVAMSAAFAHGAMLGARALPPGHDPSPRTPAEPPPAPSFACAEATQWVEKTICSDSALAALDRRLAAVFAEARQELAPQTGPLVETQRAWLEKRGECSTREHQLEEQIRCLSGQYEDRLRELILELPVLERLRAPVSDATADRVIAILRLMTPDELNEATTYENREALHAVSCRYFDRFPREAAALFDASFYSTRDSWTPLCGTTDVVTQVPATSGLVSALEAAAGDSADQRCVGTMNHGIGRTKTVARILAVVEAAPDFAAAERDRARDAEGLNYHPDVAHWALQGLWEKRRYAALRRAVAQARPPLAGDYGRRFHLDAAHAERLADYHIQRLVDVYTGRSGGSSTLRYYSMCLTRADLDAYVASGKTPDKQCPYAEFADPARSATLRRLLGLAIVNDYPLAAVQRLIAAGASLDPPAAGSSGVSESRESLLMLAAAREGVIEALLAAGADPNRRNHFGKTALMYAVQERNLGGVRRLIAAGAAVDAATAEDVDCSALREGGRTALMYAAWHGTPEIARALLEAQADATRTDTSGATAAAYLKKNRSLSPAQRQAMAAMLREAMPGAARK